MNTLMRTRVFSSIVIIVSVLLISFTLAKNPKDKCEQKPIQLLETEESDAQVHLTKEALTFLRDPVRAKRRVIPIVIVGTARSGKSFFLGMITGCRDLFPVGHSHIQKTKGARLFAIDNLQKDNVVNEDNEDKPLYVLIDTEGLGNAQNLHDKALLLFSTMASSHMVYHLSKKIDQKDIHQLSSIARLVQVFNKNNMSGAIELPPVTWVVDQSTLEDPDDSYKYLYNEVLRELPNPKGAESIAKFNEIVRVVRNEFRSQKAFFIRPALKDSDQWSSLSSIPLEQMNPGYLAQVDSVREVLNGVEPKRFVKGTEPMTCEEYASFLEVIMQTVNDESMELNHVMENVVQRAVETSKKCFEDYMTLLKLPMEKEQWKIEDETARSEAIRVFETSIVGDVDNYRNSKGRKDLELFIEQRSKLYMRDNKDASEELCREVLEDVENSLKEQVTKSLADFDGNSTVIVTEAKNRLIGPMTADCSRRIDNLRSNKRSVVAAKEAPKQVLNFFFLSIATTVVGWYLHGLFIGKIPLLNIIWGFLTTVSLAMTVVFGASFFGYSPFSEEQVMDCIRNPSIILENDIGFGVTIAVGLLAFFVFYLSRPRNINSLKPDASNNLSPRCCTIRWENCPSQEDACAAALNYLKKHKPGCPVAVIARNRVGNLRFLLPGGESFLAVAGCVSSGGDESDLTSRLQSIKSNYPGCRTVNEDDWTVMSVTIPQKSIAEIYHTFSSLWGVQSRLPVEYVSRFTPHN